MKNTTVEDIQEAEHIILVIIFRRELRNQLKNYLLYAVSIFEQLCFLCVFERHRVRLCIEIYKDFYLIIFEIKS